MNLWKSQLNPDKAQFLLDLRARWAPDLLSSICVPDGLPARVSLFSFLFDFLLFSFLFCIYYMYIIFIFNFF